MKYRISTYTLCITGQPPRGPLTQRECIAEVEADRARAIAAYAADPSPFPIAPTAEFHWVGMSDGTQVAVSNGSGVVLAEAVPVY